MEELARLLGGARTGEREHGTMFEPDVLGMKLETLPREVIGNQKVTAAFRIDDFRKPLLGGKGLVRIQGFDHQSSVHKW